MRVSARAPAFALAIATSLGLVLSAPFVGQIRSEIRRAFPGEYLAILAGAAALGLLLALVAAAWRIRDRRLARYGAITLGILIAAGYSLATASESAERNAVERFHFLQYGLITLLFYRAWRPLEDGGILLLPVLAGLTVSAAEEWLQWFIPNRVGEINDVLLNLVAIACGLLFSLGVDPPIRLDLALSSRSRRQVAGVGIATLLALALFFHVVHLGYALTDAEVGAFTSRYSHETLAALQKERTARWAVEPPPTQVVRLSREDQYLSEGMEHVRERNELWTAGDIRGAWLENRILEKYYAPVLQTPTHEGAGHRWPDAQRADAQVRASAEPNSGGFVSAAYPYRVYAWSKLAFWLAVAGLAAAIWWVGIAGSARREIYSRGRTVESRDTLR